MRAKIEARTLDQWIDEGPVDDGVVPDRSAPRGSGRRQEAEVDPEVVAQIHGAVDPRRAARLAERLASAASALDRERFEEARRMATPIARELPHVAAVHEVLGLAEYRLGNWKKAVESLERARLLHPDPALLPVLADCLRALRRWSEVEAVWDDLKERSPAHEVMAEGRIVAAGALADQGDLPGAIRLMSAVGKPPKRVRDHHLRQWYVLADLYDRAGDTIAATRWFRVILAVDAEFADVRDRLRALGR